MRQSTPDILGNVLAPQPFSQENDRGALVWLPIGRIYDNPFQPRNNYDDVDSLAESLWALREELPATLGLQQPPVARIIVFGDDGDARPVERTSYGDQGAVRRLALSDKHAVELHFGHRRLRAWKLLRDRDPGYAEFPVLLAYADDLGMWKHVVAENAQRKDINAIEEAETLRLAVDRFHLTLEQAGEPFGYSKSTISNKMRLLNLPEELRLELQAGRMTERHGRALLRLAPAPHLWSQFTRTTMLDVSVAELETQIDELVGRCQPLPPAKATGYKRVRETYNGKQLQSEQYDPPVWPYDWTPAPFEAVRGACEGCQFRATFGGDAGARCTEIGKACHTAKGRQWDAEQRAAQAKAIQWTPEPAPLTAAPAEGGPVAAQPAAPVISRISASIAADRPVVRTSDVTWFSTKSTYDSAPAALLEKGLCDIQKCSCMVVAFNQSAHEHHVRPDAEHAPNMCVGCTSTQRLSNRRKELEVGDLQEHRKRVKAEQELAEKLLNEAFDSYSADELWHNREIILAVVKGRMEIDGRYKINDNHDLFTMQRMIFLGVATSACKVWDGSSQKWSVEKVRTWLKLVAVAAGRVQPQIGMVAEPTPAPAQVEETPVSEWWRHWEDDWSDADEAAYQDIVMDWDGRAWQSLAAKATRLVHEEPLGITPAVLRRLAQECPDVTLSGHLGRLGLRLANGVM